MNYCNEGSKRQRLKGTEVFFLILFIIFFYGCLKSEATIFLDISLFRRNISLVENNFVAGFYVP